MLQGAVGQVRLVEVDGRVLVEKRMADPVRHDTEARALRALAHSGLPVPRLAAVEPGSIVMTQMPGERLDSLSTQERLDGLGASAKLLRRLHQVPPPSGLPGAPDDASIIQRYRDADGPPLPLRTPPARGPVFCHGDWTAGNLLAVDGEITAVIDWEAAHVGDPLRELSRAAWGASLNDPRSFDVMVEGYGGNPADAADAADARAWAPIHAAELWLWFREAGPPEYLSSLTLQLRNWPA